MANSEHRKRNQGIGSWRTLALLAVFGALSLPAQGLSFDAQTADIRTAGKARGATEWNLYCLGVVGSYVRTPAEGAYTVSVWAKGEPAGGVWPRMAADIDGVPGAEVTVNSPDVKRHDFTVSLSPCTHAVGVTFLNDAIVGKEDRNLILDRFAIASESASVQVEKAAKQQWESDGPFREEWTLKAAPARIQENRTREVTLALRDASGAPVRNTAVTVEQRTHEFLFGCNIGMFERFDVGDPSSTRNAQYLEEFKQVFNYATMGFWWHSFEPVDGQPIYEYTDRVLEWCLANNITPKGHPLLWNFRGGIPPWSRTLPSTERQLQRVRDILQRYGGKVRVWDVVNEPFHCPGISLDAPYALVHSLDPGAACTINEYGVMADGCPGVFDVLSTAAKEGVKFDAIGIQAHEPQNMAFPMDQVWMVLDKYASLGKPIHITEFCPCSNNRRILGATWRGTWTEEQQASYAEAFYRTCFAHPAVSAISWFDLCDIGAWRDGAGLVRRDMTPKPVYERLAKLIQTEWKTKVSGVTDDQGRFTFRGYLGGYGVSVGTAGQTRVGNFTLTRATSAVLDTHID